MDNATRVNNPPRKYFLILSDRKRSNIVMSPAAGARPYARVKPPDFQGRADFSISQPMLKSNASGRDSDWLTFRERPDQPHHAPSIHFALPVLRASAN